MSPMSTMYDRVGGMPFFATLTERFYEGVESDPVLRPLYPDDLRESREHLCLFLAQYWGGPRTYDEVRGHPRLRARHLPFSIGEDERAAWLRHMSAAVREAKLSPLDESQVLRYFEAAAAHLVNSPT